MATPVENAENNTLTNPMTPPQEITYQPTLEGLKALYEHHGKAMELIFESILSPSEPKHSEKCLPDCNYCPCHHVPPEEKVEEKQEEIKPMSKEDKDLLAAGIILADEFEEELGEE